MLTVTVDANILHALVKPQRRIHPLVTALWALHAQGRLRLVPTARWAEDVPSEPLRSQIAARLEPEAVRPAAPAEPAPRTFRRLRDLVFPGAVGTNRREARRQRDLLHLLDHRRSGRAVFLTDDKAILGRAEALARDFGIRVLGPAALLDALAAEGAPAELRARRPRAGGDRRLADREEPSGGRQRAPSLARTKHPC